MKKKFDIRMLTVSALLIALAFISVFVLKFKVSFLSFDFKDAILSMISLIYGPHIGILAVTVVSVLEFLFSNDTGVYGLIMNFISSAAFTLAAGLIYKYKRSFVGAIFSAIGAVISVTIIMMLANMIITPYYMGTDVGTVIKLIPTLLLPFNLAKSVMNAAIMLIIYKPVTGIFKRMGLIKKSEAHSGLSLKTVLLTASAVVILVLSALFIILVLNGTIVFF